MLYLWLCEIILNNAAYRQILNMRPTKCQNIADKRGLNYIWVINNSIAC